MVGASKILTVSYGTFSCTLEGFDEPFNTMKAIAEYFRDLAADDRYFGAEPPTPDAAMLHKIAEREIHRRVEAKVQDNGVILRAAEQPMLEQAAPEQPAAAPIAAAPVAQPAPPAAAFPTDDSVAAKLLRIRAAVAKSRDEAVAAAPEATAPAPEFIEPEFIEDEYANEPVAEAASPLAHAFIDEDMPVEEYAAPPAEPIADALPEDEYAYDVAEPEPVFEAPELAAEIDALPEDAAEIVTSEDTAEDLLPEDLAQAEDALLSGFAIEQAAQPDETDTDDIEADVELDAAQTEINEDAFVSEETEAVAEVALELGVTGDADVALELDVAFDGDAEAEDESLGDVAPEAQAEAATEVEAPAETEASSEPEISAAPQPAEDAAVAAHAEIVIADEPAAASSDIFSAEVSPISEKVRRARARVIKVRRLEVTPAAAPAVEAAPQAYAPLALAPQAQPPLKPAAPAPAPTEEIDDDFDIFAETDVPATADTPVELSAEAEADLLRELAAVEDEIETGRGAASEGRTILEAESRDDASVSRLLRQTNTEMAGTETRRRVSTINHLKAAVAAATAEQMVPKSGLSEEASALDRFRNDLSLVMQPRHPASAGLGKRPAPAGDRPAPLVLVSEQRIDRSAPPRPDAAPAPAHVVRPRRVASGNLAVQDDDEADQDPGNIFTSARSFNEFAERMGATELPDLLEAAAAYASCVEGRPHFSRPQLMRHLSSLEDITISREDGLRSFGTLLRQGKIEKFKRGQFVISEDSRFVSEARKIAE